MKSKRRRKSFLVLERMLPLNCWSCRVCLHRFRVFVSSPGPSLPFIPHLRVPPVRGFPRRTGELGICTHACGTRPDHTNSCLFFVFILCIEPHDLFFLRLDMLHSVPSILFATTLEPRTRTCTRVVMQCRYWSSRRSRSFRDPCQD